MLRLPPLECLRFFEAAARRESFKRAADELGVTPGAVSHRVRRLESHLGGGLFDRGRRGVRLNARGEAFLADVRELLWDIQRVTDEHCVSRGKRRLRIISVEAVAERWLMPRLARFMAACPDLAIELDTDHRGFDRARRDFDVWIAYVDGVATPHPQDLDEIPLFDESLVPVCSPGLLRERGRPARPTELHDWPLLFDLGMQEAWRYWFRRQGCPAPDLSGACGFRLYSMVVRAATDGMGVAMGHSKLIAEELRAGALVPVFGELADAPARCSLLPSALSDGKPEVHEFREWLTAPG